MGYEDVFDKLHYTLKWIVISVGTIGAFWYFDLKVFSTYFAYPQHEELPYLFSFCLSVCTYMMNSIIVYLNFPLTYMDSTQNPPVPKAINRAIPQIVILAYSILVIAIASIIVYKIDKTLEVIIWSVFITFSLPLTLTAYKSLK